MPTLQMAIKMGRFSTTCTTHRDKRLKRRASSSFPFSPQMPWALGRKQLRMYWANKIQFLTICTRLRTIFSLRSRIILNRLTLKGIRVLAPPTTSTEGLHSTQIKFLSRITLLATCLRSQTAIKILRVSIRLISRIHSGNSNLMWKVEMLNLLAQSATRIAQTNIRAIHQDKSHLLLKILTTFFPLKASALPKGVCQPPWALKKSDQPLCK